MFRPTSDWFPYLLALILLWSCDPSGRARADDFPKGFLEDIVQSSVVKARLNSRWKWEAWDVVPGTHVYNIYVFNLTNPHEFEAGAKPVFQQVGPYTYVEGRTKFDESVNLDLTVNFERNFTYIFDPAKSKGKESDLVNVVNVPFVIFSTLAARSTGHEGIAAINRLAQAGETLTKSHVRVGDLVFDGMDVTKYKPYLSLMGDLSSWLVHEFASGRYGVMKIKRGAHEGPYTVDGGLEDQSRFGMIKLWSGDTKLKWWSAPSCNAINGTDGTVYPPFVGKNDVLNIFDIDLCRSIQFDYVGDDLFRGTVEEYRFKLVDDLLEDPRVAKKNACFCKSGSECLKAGVLDVSACQMGAPYVLSYPHFTNASSEYLEGVSGLKPDPKAYATFLEIQPRLGVIISYSKKLQWNLQLAPIPGVAAFSNLKQSMLMPVLWNDDEFQLDPDKADLLVAEIANLDGGGGSGASSLLSLGSGINYGVMHLFLALAFIAARANLQH